MHNLARRRSLVGTRSRRRRQHLSSTHAVRVAGVSDVDQIVDLTAAFVASGALLPRTAADIAATIENYMVAVDGAGRVCACALLTEYSPALGEVGSVAVAPSQQGLGLGTMVVRAIESLARQRGIGELIAVSAAPGFFTALGFEPTEIAAYPEKLAAYRAMGRAVSAQRKGCFRKNLAA